MYRNYMQNKSCCTCNNKCNDNKEDLIEDTCKYVENAVETKDACECGFDEEYEMGVFPENPMLAQSYVPWQFMDKTFKPEVGLKMGTIYPELVSPYMPCQSMRVNEYLEATNKIGEGCNKC